jgi:hypothetical protein
MLKNLLLKKDHYEVEYLLECKNCQIIQSDTEYIYIKTNFDIFSQLKKEIVKLLHKNPELYCDCKKEIFNFDSFEEVVKVKKNGIDIQNEIVDLSILLYGIWFSPKGSYGPMLKVTNVTTQTTNFLPDPDDYNSDEEIEKTILQIKKKK